MPESRPFRRIRYLERITLAGSLCMIYLPCVASPVTTDLFRHLGATEYHFGLLVGIPQLLIVLQFVGAHWTNRMRHRRAWFMTLCIAGRLLYVPVALLPFVPGFPSAALVPMMIALIALGTALQTVTYPMWLSWMGDLIPKRILNRYWGGRQRYLTLTMLATSLAVTVFTLYTHDVPIKVVFLILALIGCTAGTIDLLLFRRVREPPNVLTRSHPWTALKQPLQDPNFRKLVRFVVIFYGISSPASAFMLIYTLGVLQVPLWQTALLWCTPSLGAAMVAPLWGRIADRFGHRPILRVCVLFKPMICIAFMLVTPALALPVLALALFFDNMLNCGMEIATNGYMLKMAPRENRAMFIVSVTALTGIAMGLGAVLGGSFMHHTSGFSLHLAGRDWNHYQLIFLISTLLRLPCIALAGRIREPTSAPSREVVEHLMGIWPISLLLYPVSFFRRKQAAEEM